MSRAQIDWLEGERRKRKGIEQVIDHEHEQWKYDYVRLATVYVTNLTAGTCFTAEQVRARVQEEIGVPHHPNVWSAMFHGTLKKWRKAGYVESTGRVLDATNFQAHRRAIRLYKRV